MFTGIVEEVGEVTGIDPQGKGVTLRISAARVLDGLAPGDSVAVDGVCLTATSVDAQGFSADVAAMTLGRTIAGGYRSGSKVNLERALSFGGRLGGHLVSGHVDGVGWVEGVDERSEMVLVDFSVPDEVIGVTVLHGSIALNGVSLTVNRLPRPGLCQVAVIPFTREHTTLGALRAGDEVNLEGDLIGKFVRNLLGAPARAGEPGEAGRDAQLRAWGYA